MTARRFDTAVIIGPGLLGASLGLALKERGLARLVRGVGHRQATVDGALRVGAIDEGGLDPAAACEDADLVVICTPAALVAPMIDAVAPVCQEGAVITDVASTKSAICAHAAVRWPEARPFVGSHPMAGSEKWGPEHASASLYEGRVTVVEADPQGAAPGVQEAVENLWKAVGSEVARMDPARHDAVVARTSHVPHIAAAALAEIADAAGPEARLLTGQGFRDTTRIAAGRASIWRDICLTNQGPVTEALDDMAARIAEVRHAVASGDGDALALFFDSAREARLSLEPPAAEPGQAAGQP